MTKKISPFEPDRPRRLTACAVLVALPFVALILFGSSEAARGQATEQRTFATPEAAVEALVKSLNADDAADIIEILGPKHEESLIGGDEIAVRENRKRAGAAATEKAELHDAGEGRKILIIGRKSWPVPFPIVQAGDRWRFDTEAGLEELINRRIGRNELNVIKICHQYIDAQVDYASKDRDGDQVLEYAQQVISSEGQQDGLYWDSVAGEEFSPFGPLVADARNYLDGREPGDPYKGYYFKIITRQGEDAIGGRYDYIINGNMIVGFALIAFPAEHGNSGIMTFICSHTGRIHQKNMGPDGDLIAGAMSIHNPDVSWILVGE
jgi:hypothetical protein